MRVEIWTAGSTSKVQREQLFVIQSQFHRTSTVSRQFRGCVPRYFLYSGVHKIQNSDITALCAWILHYVIFYGFQLRGAQKEAVIPPQYWTGTPFLRRPKWMIHYMSHLIGMLHPHGVIPQSNLNTQVLTTKIAVPRRMRQNTAKAEVPDAWVC